MSTPKYRDAIRRLNLLQSGYMKLYRRRMDGPAEEGILAVQHMPTWLSHLGIQVGDLDKLNVIHIAGTKGKGSTAAYVNAILNECRQKTGMPKKIGLYTSPHLTSVRERFVINSSPLSEEAFVRYHDDVEKSLIQTKAPMPGYFRFLTIMAFHAFLQEKVDVVILETGVGGEHDATNVVRKPSVVGITSLDFDHVGTLGPNIERIAWHKAGIMKPGVPAFTVPQG